MGSVGCIIHLFFAGDAAHGAIALGNSWIMTQVIMHPITAKIHEAIKVQVPELDSFIPTSRRDRLSIRAKADTPHKGIVPSQRGDQSAISLPQLDGVIVTTRHDRLSIRAKADTHYRVSVTLQCSNRRTVSLPQLDRVIPTP